MLWGEGGYFTFSPKLWKMGFKFYIFTTIHGNCGLKSLFFLISEQGRLNSVYTWPCRVQYTWKQHMVCVWVVGHSGRQIQMRNDWLGGNTELQLTLELLQNHHIACLFLVLLHLVAHLLTITKSSLHWMTIILLCATKTHLLVIKARVVKSWKILAGSSEYCLMQTV